MPTPEEQKTRDHQERIEGRIDGVMQVLYCLTAILFIVVFALEWGFYQQGKQIESLRTEVVSTCH